MEGDDMYQSLKGRLRRPSAKALAAAVKPESISAATEPVAVVKAPPTSVLSLQSGVAEMVMNDEELPEEPIEARPDAVTLETVAAAEWRQKGFAKTPVRRPSSRRTEQKISTPKAAPTKLEIAADEPKLVEAKTEESGERLQDDSESDSETTVSVRPDGSVPGAASPTEVKRKRGRPFKGQEKPVEERLMIETCKIRRLIDDIMRKGTAESELCLRLRNIAKELDEVMSIGFAHVVVDEEPTPSAIPDTLLPDTLAAAEPVIEAESVPLESSETIVDQPAEIAQEQ
jgi:hypothetical protein